MSDVIISVEHVFKSVTDATGTLEILRDIDFRLAPQETAAIVGALLYLFPELPWAWQLLLFGCLSILTAVFWWRRQRAAAKPSDQPGLNQRGSELQGRQFVLHEAIVGGRGKIKAGDSLWLVTGPDLPAGTPIKVVGQDGVLLKVQQAD